MEPVSILGAAASAATVVQLCTTGLQSLTRLQHKFSNADLTVRLLITHLSTLRTALGQICEWVEKHAKLSLKNVLPDLTASLDGCKFLIETLNDRLDSLAYDDIKGFGMLKKTRMIWAEKERQSFSTLLGHNIAALQLLLTAMQCQSQSEQTILLQDLGNREIIVKARDDTSSLLWLRDDESHDTRRSTCTENSDLLDSSFSFDREIFSSKAYISTMQSNMKRVVREAHSKAQAKRPTRDTLDGVLQSDEDTQKITGDTSGYLESIDDLQIPTPPESVAVEAQSFAGSSRESVTRVHGKDGLIRGSNSLEEAYSASSGQALVDYEPGKFSPRIMSQASRRVLRMPSLLKSRSFISSQSSVDTDVEIRRSITRDEEKLLFVGNAKGSGSTILRSIQLAFGGICDTTNSEIDSVQEVLISRKYAGVRYNYRIYDVIGLHSRENEWIRASDEMSALIYVVDLSAYNCQPSDHQPMSRIHDDLALFQQICSSKWLAMTPILLLLSSIDVLAWKSTLYPLVDHFPEFAGSSDDLEAAKSFFRQKFLSLNKKYDMSIRVAFTDSVTTVKLGKLVVTNIDKMLTERKVLAFGAR